MQVQHPSIARSIRKQKDEPIRAKVPLLEERLPLHRLHIRHSRLGLDEGCAGRAVDQAIPCAQVAGDRHGHLGAPSKTLMQAAPESVKQRQVRSVSNRIPTRMQRRGQLKADRGRDASRQVNRERARLATLGTLDPMRAHADDACQFTDAHPGAHARVGEVVANALAEQPAPLCADRCDALLASHWDSIEEGGRLRLI
jgi:hypothetical protein